MTKVSTVYRKKYDVVVADDFYGADSTNGGNIVRMDFEAVAGLIKTLNSGISKDMFVYNESPTGLINGINATFLSQNNFTSGTVEVYLNGSLQRIVNDYQIIGNTTISLNTSPTTGETISINYIKL